MGSFVVYTLVLPELREMMRARTIRLNVTSIDVLGPVMQAFIDTFNDSPKRKAGLLHQMDEDYYKRVEAIEFAVKSDDGKDTSAEKQAHIVLIGRFKDVENPVKYLFGAQRV